MDYTIWTHNIFYYRNHDITIPKSTTKKKALVDLVLVSAMVNAQSGRLIPRTY
ncbi:hypothetical protein AAJ76_1700011640 [Vairimorpha ceranae]|uniref:Uncharacterized protein n=1 Tax=Vairimorpha ceranae TaxID=40302 RepID=A0A0F9WRP1_9MICR|nr:hypothetical protein AAJ76_1700011640 [Vairimorpha ceranae]KKO75568.1 hypothetical protein AAJ76_1700011640 [Vairimorpha ceranae]